MLNPPYYVTASIFISGTEYDNKSATEEEESNMLQLHVLMKILLAMSLPSACKRALIPQMSEAMGQSRVGIYLAFKFLCLLFYLFAILIVYKFVNQI